MKSIAEIIRIPYKVRNSFYEINEATMWACKDTVKHLSYIQGKRSELCDKPISIKTHIFDE